MMSEQPKSNYDKFNWWLRNNKITASLIIFGVIVIALSTFTEAAKNLLDLIDLKKRPDINGEWKAEVTYDWPNANYSETFIFEGEGEELRGTASFLKIDRVITEGELTKNEIHFTTKTRESSSWDEGNSAEVLHHYFGIIDSDKINFTMLTEGGYSTHVPIKFTAQRVTK